MGKKSKLISRTLGRQN